ncbi:MAG: S-layer homology domain-containing protein, partial [Oscillospiraceae bacterium]|nr:S-layer homology domain-containing protein [Oscillospiraceae bacterium]
GGGGGGGWPTAPVITITSQPANATVPLGEIDSNLYVTATVTQNATRSYRWYRATDADRTGASTFTGATTATFPKPADLTGATYYFYVVVSAPGATSVRSDVAVVTVLADTGTDGFPFIDVARTDWFYPYVRTVWENQLFQGTSHNMFTPQGSMTRAMFVQVLANMENVDLTAYQANSANPRFNDVSPAAWYFPAVEWAAGQGLVQGVGNGNFQPGRAITREEMAVMLHNYVVSRNIALSQGVLHTFTDQAAISDWAVDGVRAIQEAGIIVGHPNGSFAPRATATRAEVATIFARFLEVTGN